MERMLRHLRIAEDREGILREMMETYGGMNPQAGCRLSLLDQLLLLLVTILPFWC